MSWIDCTQELPDDEMTVLVHCPEGSEPVWMGYHEAGEWYPVEGGYPIEVTHWMPLPELPVAKERGA